MSKHNIPHNMNIARYNTTQPLTLIIDIYWGDWWSYGRYPA